MPKSLNRVTLLGHVGKDVALTYTTNGVPCAKFSMATSSSYKKDGEWVDQTEWHNLVLWQKVAEVAGEHVHKGDKIMVEGRIQTRSWDDKKSGEKRYITEIVVYDLFLLGSKRDSGEHEERSDSRSDRKSEQRSSNRGGSEAQNNAEITDDDIPFILKELNVIECPLSWHKKRRFA